MKILRKRMKELRLLVALIRRKLGRYLNQQLLLRLKQLIIATRKLQLSRQLSRVRPSSITKIDHKAENSYSERSIAKAYLSEGKDRQLNAKFNMQDALYRQYVASSVVAHHLYISKVNYFVTVMIHQAQMTSDPVKLQQINHFHNYAVYAAIENDTEPRFLQWMYATVPRNFLYHISFGNKTSIFVTFNSSWVLTDPVKATLVNVPIMYLSKINNVEMFSLTSIPAENILSFSRINQSLAFDSTLTALAGDSYQFPNYISSPLMIGDNLDKSLALMVSTGFPRAGITACIGIPTAFGVIVTANVSDGQYVTSCASSNYGGDIESEEEENKMRTRSFKLSYHYIPEYQKRFNGHPWKYFAPPSNHQLLQYSDSDTNSYYESVKLEKKTKYTRKFKQRHAGNQRGHSTVTESQSTGGHETLSIESL